MDKLKNIVVLGILALSVNVSAQETVEPLDFKSETLELVQTLSQTAQLMAAGYHHRETANHMLLSLMVLRPSDISDPGYQNNMEQSQKPLRDMTEANDRINENAAIRIAVANDPLPAYLSRTDGPHNAAEVRTLVKKLVEAQNAYISASEKHAKLRITLNDPLQARSGYALVQSGPDHYAIEDKYHETKRALAPIVVEIRTLLDTPRAKTKSEIIFEKLQKCARAVIG